MNKTKVIFPLKIFETFAGIGAQHKAINKIDANNKHFIIKKTSEWDARAIIAYAQIHNNKKYNIELNKINKWDENEINKYIFKRTYSLDSKKPGRVISKNLEFKKSLIASTIANNNYSDIKAVEGEELLGIDLLTYSFPCQGLSIANMGRGEGIKTNSNSTSNLIWEIRRILLDAISKKVSLPKYLLMENVVNLLSKSHIGDYKSWKTFLSSIGYVTKTLVLNGLNHGSLQKRKRVFAISILNWENNMSDEDFQNMFNNKYSNKLSSVMRKEKYLEILNSSNSYKDEILSAIPKNTPSRIKMATHNHDLLKRKWAKFNEYTFNTLTTKQDRHPNIGMISIKKIPKMLGKRFITPREAYMIMGFESKDFDAVKPLYQKNIITKESLYRQAGNSIVVNVLEDIFKFIKDFEKRENGFS